ncbi:MAG: ABC transporter ATP-binding protein [Opitutales bacterium]
MITLSDICHRYPDSGFELKMKHLKVSAGERMAIVGKSGAGKTTLLNMMSGAIVPTQGVVEVDGVQVSELSESKRRDFRIQNIGMAFQSFELLDYLIVQDNILLSYRMSSALQLDSEVKSRACLLAELTGLGDKLNRNVQTLSQGERQRVSICRAILPRPKILIADEPTANLDPGNSEKVFEIILGYLEETGATFICATHEYDLLKYFERTLDFKDIR